MPTVVEVQEHEYKRLKEQDRMATDLKATVRELIGIIKASLLTLWWVLGIAGTAALFFYPMAMNRLQAIAFAVAMVVCSLISKALYKVKEVEGKYS